VYECMSMNPRLTPLRLRLLQKGDIVARKPEIYTAFLK
jgi:hypothetical protein